MLNFHFPETCSILNATSVYFRNYIVLRHLKSLLVMASTATASAATAANADARCRAAPDGKGE